MIIIRTGVDVWIKANWLAFLCYIPIANLPGRSGAKVRDHASLPGASSTQQTRHSRTLVDPVSLFLFVGCKVVSPTSTLYYVK